jgi:AcrR family transcriptional regulator
MTIDPRTRLRRRPGTRSADAPDLDRRVILQAALRLVDADGLQALSMRRLGAELGVEAMSLYHYLPNKAALTDGLAEIVLEQMRLPTDVPPAGWPSALREVARSFRQLGLAHPNVFPLLTQVGLDNPAVYPPTEAILALLRSAGFGEQLAFTAFSSVKSYVVGHVLWTQGDPWLGKGDKQCLPAPEAFPAERFPHLAAYLPYVCDCDDDAEFERGLDVLIAGLQTLAGLDSQFS